MSYNTTLCSMGVRQDVVKGWGDGEKSAYDLDLGAKAVETERNGRMRGMSDVGRESGTNGGIGPSRRLD